MEDAPFRGSPESGVLLWLLATFATHPCWVGTSVDWNRTCNRLYVLSTRRPWNAAYYRKICVAAWPEQRRAITLRTPTALRVHALSPCTSRKELPRIALHTGRLAQSVSRGP